MNIRLACSGSLAEDIKDYILEVGEGVRSVGDKVLSVDDGAR